MNELSVGSSNAFDATENPQKDIDRELSDEELDDLIDGVNKNISASVRQFYRAIKNLSNLISSASSVTSTSETIAPFGPCWHQR